MEPKIFLTSIFLLIQYFWTKIFFNPNFSLLKIRFHFKFLKKNFLDPNHSGPKIFGPNFFWIQNFFGSKIQLDQKHFWSKIFKFPNILRYIWTQIFFFYSRSFWTKIFLDETFFWQIFFIHKWTQHFLHPDILFKLMSIWLNLNLQSNCLSLDWAPAQLQLVVVVAAVSYGIVFKVD